MEKRVVQIQMDVVVDTDENGKIYDPSHAIATAVECELDYEFLGCESVISWDYDKYMKGEVK